ncbi:MAG: tetratricopeptide repeat protein [Saprospiraceae bacterium]|nr:tetratricopeptide repeat protein [Saprospiraceae bacterium]
MKNILILILWLSLSNNAYSQSGNSKCLEEGIKKANLKDFKGAIELFSSCITQEPTNATAYYNRGLAKFEVEDFTGALQDYDNAIKNNNKYVSAYYNRGVLKHQLGLVEKAIEDYDKCIEIDPKNAPEAFINKGLALIQQGNKEGGCIEIAYSIYCHQENLNTTYLILLDHCEGTAGYFFVEGMTEQNLDSAKISFDKAIWKKSDYTSAYFERAKINMKLLNYDAALLDLDHVIETDNKSTSTVNGKYNFFQDNQDYSKIPNLEEAYLLRGIKTTLKVRAMDSLLNIIRSTTNKNSEEVIRARYALADYSNNPPSSKKALEDFTIVTIIKPDFAEAYFHRANCWLWCSTPSFGSKNAF